MSKPVIVPERDTFLAPPFSASKLSLRHRQSSQDRSEHIRRPKDVTSSFVIQQKSQKGKQHERRICFFVRFLFSLFLSAYLLVFELATNCSEFLCMTFGCFSF